MSAHLVIFSWVYPTCRAAQVAVPVSLLACLLLAAYHALYFGAFFGLLARRPAQSVLWPFSAAALWVSLEFLRTHALSGFPWCLTALSQWKNLPVLQISELTGPYGIGFLVLLANASVAFLWSGTPRLSRSAALALAAATLGSAVLFGVLRLRNFPPPAGPEGKALSVAILQGNIDQYRKWDESYEGDIRTVYESLIDDARTGRPDLIVWPETSVPGWFPNESRYVEWVVESAVRSGTHNLVGAVTSKDGRDFNGAHLVSPRGALLGSYFKIRLVPFGEFVPFKRLLAPWIHVLNELGGFSAGGDLRPLSHPRAAFGVTICYEAVFPALVRSIRKAGAQFLVNITNDGWFLDTSAPEQHLAANVLRAVETRAHVVRAANTGISCIVEPSGRVQGRLDLLARGVLRGRVVPDSLQSPYVRWGDWFAWLCVLISILFLTNPRPRNT